MQSRTSAILVACVMLVSVMGAFVGPMATTVAADTGVAYADGPVTITDGRGVDVTFDEVPQRIVSLGSSFTGTLVAIGASDQIVGIDEGSLVIEGMENMTVVGKTKPTTTVMENVLNLSADCVICWNFGSYQDGISALESYDVKVLAFYPSSLDAYLDLIFSLGILTDKRDVSDDVVETCEAIIAEVAKKTADLPQNKTVYFELMSWDASAVGGKGFTSDLLAACGLDNIFSDVDKSTFKASYEEILGDNPDIIFKEVDDEATDEEIEDAIEAIMDREGFHAISAVQQGNVFAIKHQLIAMTPDMVLGMREMAKAAYPELFADGPAVSDASKNWTIKATNWTIDTTFDEVMDTDTLIVRVNGVVANWTLSGNNITIAPSQELESGTDYMVNITGEDIFGNQLVGAEWTFTTVVADPDTVVADPDSTLLYVGIGLAALVILALAVVMFKRRG